MLNRAYSILNVKELDDEQRIFRGIATTPTPDRVQDIVEPLGVKVAPTIPLLLYHDSRQPVGIVKFGAATKTGIPFEASIPKVIELGKLKDRVDEAWQMVKYRLITAVSIGFQPVADKVEQLKSGGLRFIESTVLELSLVPIPAQAEALISYVKQLDDQQRAALGNAPIDQPALTPPPGASGKQQHITPVNRKGIKVATIQEQLSSFEATRQAKDARMAALMDKAAEEGRTFDDSETEEYDGLETEVKQLDSHLTRLRAREKANVATATPVNGATQEAGTASRQGSVIHMGKSNLPKGTAFTRYAMALAHSKGNLVQAEQIAKRWHDSTPEVEIALKAAMTAGSTTTSHWASELVEYNTMAGEFLELLRPATILGKLDGLRRVPFNVRIIGQTQGATVNWVGQGLAKPVSELALTSVTLGFAKIAGIVVITQELARFSSPSAEQLVRDDLVKTIAQFMDQQFIDPGVAAVANVSPASITNGITPTQSTGATVALVTADVSALFRGFIAAGLAPTKGVWIMSASSALALSLLRTSQDIFAFPNINMTGGTFFGLPVVVSESVPHSTSAGSIIILLDQSEVYIADDGGVSIDVSEQASLQMNSTPSAGAQSLVSLWAQNLVGIRAERFCTWQRRRDTAVAYLDNVHY